MPKETPIYSFYRPHDRVQEDGRLVNPHNGEITYPPSMTKQEFVRECDINNIVKLYSQSGQITHISANAASGAFEDLPDPIDFQESIHIIMDAEKAFMALPAHVRDRFHQEPSQFLAFMADPANEKEARELGLLKPQAPPAEPVEVRVVEPVKPPSDQ